jgi:hypothetical protein
VAVERLRRPGGRTGVIIGCGAVVVLAAGAWAARDALSGTGKPPEPVVRTSTAPVTRTDVAQRQQVNGTLSHEGT